MVDWLVQRTTGQARTDAHVGQIISLLKVNSTREFHQRIDKVRTFINDSSMHKIDQQFRAN